MDGINITGWPFTKAGIGEHARRVAQGLDETNIDYAVIDSLEYCFRDSSIMDNSDGLLRKFQASSLSYSTTIHCLNLNHLHRLPSSLFASSYNVCYGYYEMSHPMDAFIEAEKFCDEIWAPTQFIGKVLSRYVSIPVVYMPIALETRGVRRCIRSNYKLPKDQFLYLTSFDARSLIERKNPFAVIEAFKKAFLRLNVNASLVIKVNASKSDPVQKRSLEKLIKKIEGDKRIILLDVVLDRDAMHDLVWSTDAYVSLHRAEGLGLGMAEAMSMGKPVIATGYSGNMDFMDNSNSMPVRFELISDKTCEAVQPGFDWDRRFVWADADVEHAAYCIRKIFSDSVFRHEISKRAQADIEHNFSYEAVGKMYSDRLEIINKKI